MRANHEIRVKLTAEELKKIQDKAKVLGLNSSTYLRMLGLKANIEIS